MGTKRPEPLHEGREDKRFHELLFKQLRDISQEEDLSVTAPPAHSAVHTKMEDWEASYRAMRQVQDNLARAYNELQVSSQTS